MLIGPSKGACGLDLGLLAARGAMQTMDKINDQLAKESGNRLRRVGLGILSIWVIRFGLFVFWKFRVLQIENRNF